MKLQASRRSWALPRLFCCSLTATAAATSPASLRGFKPHRSASRRRAARRVPIQHVVIVVQENRTFNDFFATFPGADGTTTGKAVPNRIAARRSKRARLPDQRAACLPKDLNHSYPGTRLRTTAASWTVSTSPSSATATPSARIPISTPIRRGSSPTGTWRRSTRWPSTCSRPKAAAASPRIRTSSAEERSSRRARRWSIFRLVRAAFGDATRRPARITSLITEKDVYLKGAGPLPCTTNFSVSYPTLRDLLDAKGLSWKYYQPPFKKLYGKLLSAFDVIAAVRNGPEWKNNVITPGVGDLQRHLRRETAGGLVGDTRSAGIRPPRPVARHRTAMGRERRERRR